MRLEPDDDQLALMGAVRSVLEDHVPSARHARRDGGDLDRTLWGLLGDLGVFGLLVPESAGGLAMRTIDACLVLEEIGHSGLWGPGLETLVVVAPLLAQVDDDRTSLLPDVLSGRTVATSTLGHRSRLAADVGEASVVCAVDSVISLDTVDCFRWQVQRTLDSTRRVASVVSSGARTVSLSPAQRADLDDQILVANAAQLVGNATALLAQSVDYAGQRRQFGRVIGSFQALKHMLADVQVEIEVARAAVWAAALALDEDPHSGPRVSARVAAALSSQAAERANQVALQVHGGIGYTWEHDLQIWLKQGLVLARRLGTANHHRRIAAQLAGVLPADEADDTGRVA